LKKTRREKEEKKRKEKKKGKNENKVELKKNCKEGATPKKYAVARSGRHHHVWEYQLVFFLFTFSLSFLFFS